MNVMYVDQVGSGYITFEHCLRLCFMFDTLQMTFTNLLLLSVDQYGRATARIQASEAWFASAGTRHTWPALFRHIGRVE